MQVYAIQIFCTYKLNLFDIHGIYIVYVSNITSIYVTYHRPSIKSPWKTLKVLEDYRGGQIETGTHQSAWTYWTWMFPTLLVSWEYQNQLHHVRLACCPLRHQKAARGGDECHETLKQKLDTSICQLSILYTSVCWLIAWYIHGIYWCRMNTHGAADLYLVCMIIYMIYICYSLVIYLLCTWYIQVICRCHTYGGYIHSKTFLGLFHTFFVMICLWYSMNIKSIFMPYQWYIIKKTNGTNPKILFLFFSLSDFLGCCTFDIGLMINQKSIRHHDTS